MPDNMDDTHRRRAHAMANCLTLGVEAAHAALLALEGSADQLATEARQRLRDFLTRTDALKTGGQS